MESPFDNLPIEMVAHVLSKVDLADLCRARVVSKVFQQAVAKVAPVERVPELLLSSSFEEICDIDKKIPSLNKCISWAAFAGKMKDEVWRSPLVQHLVAIDELDALPWKEFIFSRVCQQWGGNDSPGSEPTFVEAETFGELVCDFNDDVKAHSTKSKKSARRYKRAYADKPSDNAIVLPTLTRLTDSQGIHVFNLSNWSEYMVQFVPSEYLYNRHSLVIFSDWNDTLTEAAEWPEDALYQTLLDLEEWFKELAAHSGLPAWQTKRWMYEPNAWKFLPGIYSGDWGFYHVQMANYFIVLFLFSG